MNSLQINKLFKCLINISENSNSKKRLLSSTSSLSLQQNLNLNSSLLCQPIFKRNLFQIAIDGPAASGKSTTARLVAQQLNFEYIDSGAMYRTITFAALKENLNPTSLIDSYKIINIAKTSKIQLITIDNGTPPLAHTSPPQPLLPKTRVLFNEEDITEKIMLPEITRNITGIASNPGVREALVVKQRAMAECVVMDGRDIGTVILPNAHLKLFIIADPKIRAERRLKELKRIKKMENLEMSEVLADLLRRDKNDTERKISPLKMADDAILLDTSGLSIEEQVERIIKLALEKMRKNIEYLNENIAISPEEKFMAYLPHSGFNNQRIALENAIFLSWYLKRTLIVPPIIYFKNISPFGKQRFHPHYSRLAQLPLDKNEFIDCQERKNKTHVYQYCVDALYTFYNWEYLFSFKFIKENIRIIHRTDFLHQNLLNYLKITSNNQTLNMTNDQFKFTQRYYDNVESVEPLNEFKERVNLQDLLSKSEKLIHFASVYSINRLVIELPKNKIFWNDLIHDMIPNNPIILKIVDNIVKRIGGINTYFGVHIRIGKGFETRTDTSIKNITRDIKLDFSETVASMDMKTTTLNPHFNKTCYPEFTSKYPKYPIIIYLATFVSRYHKSLKPFMKEFPCVYVLKDFKQELEPMKIITNPKDGLNMYEYFTSLVDILVASKGIKFYGTYLSTASMLESKKMPFGISYDIVSTLARWSIHGFYREIRIMGYENVPKEGPLIVCCTHNNMVVDPAILATTFPHKRKIHLWAKNSLFFNKIFNYILYNGGVVPVDRTTKNNQALFAATFEVLQKGEIVAVFPEEFKDGASWENKKKQNEPMPASIIPCGITYVQKSKYRSLVIIAYGRQIHVEPYIKDFETDNRTAVKKLTKRIQTEMEKLTINAPNWEISNAATMTRLLLFSDDKLLSLENFVRTTQSLINFYTNTTSDEVISLKTSLNQYKTALDDFSLLNADIKRYEKHILSITRTFYTLIYELFIFLIQLPFFLPGIIFHWPIYVLGKISVKFEKYEESIAQNKIILELIASFRLFAALFNGKGSKSRELVESLVIKRRQCLDELTQISKEYRSKNDDLRFVLEFSEKEYYSNEKVKE
ncbi:9622_t:CDS:10 [Diversispora eburnea]|uniref:(d)CMP kinase n=1 Tax=Diversispora eburnea TaxID=1213867 RepID=A0A9N9AL30_9GLOM|nr:9622_t:CDS:10 [Diversispora eburnea]